VATDRALSAVGRYNWSIRDERLLEAIAGIEYNAGCWAMRFVAQRLTAITGVPNNSFFLQLELNDFGSIGSNPLTLLRRSVPGYGKINELPDAGSPLSTQ
jgi:LPS-assembly protein